MKKTLILYTSEYAESIASAVIQKLKNMNAECIDISTEDKTIKPNSNKIEKIYCMAEIDDEKFMNHKKVVTIDPMSKKSKDYRRRVILVWEREFPGVTIPRVINLIGGHKVSEKDEKDASVIGLSVETFLKDLSMAGMTRWKSLLAAPFNNHLLTDLIHKGHVINEYIKSKGAEEGQIISQKDLDEQQERFKKVLKDIEGKIKKEEAENKSLKEKLSWFESKFSEKEIWSKKTKKELKEEYTVKEMKFFCKKNGISGYSNLKEDDLVDLIKSSFKYE